MSISRKFSKSPGRSWISDIVANTPSLSKKRSSNEGEKFQYKNGVGSVRSVSHSTPSYPIITGSSGDNQMNPSSPSYPIITSSRQRSTSLHEKIYYTSNSSLIKSATLKARKKLPLMKFHDEEIISSTIGRSGKKHSAPPLFNYDKPEEAAPVATRPVYDSVPLDMPTAPQGYQLDKPAHVGHYKKKEQKKKFIDSGYKTLDRNHFSRIRVRALS